MFDWSGKNADMSGKSQGILISCVSGNNETPFRGHPDERQTYLKRSLDNVNLNINLLIPNPDERPPLVKVLFSGAKGVALQEGFLCI